MNDLSNIRFLVLDEADRMTQEHSFPQLVKILDSINAANPSENDMGDDNNGGDDEIDVRESVRDVIIRDALPGFAGDSVEADGGDASWVSLSREQQLSSAPPAAEAPRNERTGDRLLAAELAGLTNPEGYDWFSRSLAPPSRIPALRKIVSLFDERINI